MTMAVRKTKQASEKFERIISLSPEDSLIFAESLLNPPEPNQALIKAMRDYHESEIQSDIK